MTHIKSVAIRPRVPVHPFPARMAPDIALRILSKSKKPIRVFDPMMGSGTVLSVARSKGHRAVGIDIDPLAVLISGVWTSAIDPDEVKIRAILVLIRARRQFAKLSLRRAYPSGADVKTRRFVRYWFDGYVRRQLTCLAASIRRVHDKPVRDVLWCAFSRLIITKQSGVSLAMDLSHSRPHKTFKYAPIKPFNEFLKVVDQVIRGCINKSSKNRGPKPRICEGDARATPLEDGSVDLVLTFPPYLNAIDYIRCSKFTLIWMGYPIGKLSNLRRASIGSEIQASSSDEEMREILKQLKLRPRLPSRQEGILINYMKDMKEALRETNRVLTRKGKAVYVMGENTVRGTYIRTSRLIRLLARKAGLIQSYRYERKLVSSRRYLPPPTHCTKATPLGSRMRREVILYFKRA